MLGSQLGGLLSRSGAGVTSGVGSSFPTHPADDRQIETRSKAGIRRNIHLATGFIIALVLCTCQQGAGMTSDCV